MSTVTDNDLKELRDLINDRFNELRLNQEKIMTRLEDWKLFQKYRQDACSTVIKS
ncbi:hypothetical protein ACN4EE_17460 [Geminocystis sp. CENA526]|uniref:hypothetical protein n=1 Tax=Geminocystis sp. CENA526 TaxID=1355871 RepID=UPI003D6F5D50